MARAPPLRLLLLILHVLVTIAIADVPDRYVVGYFPGDDDGTKVYLDPTYPAPHLPLSGPSCTVPLVAQAFADTYGRAPTEATYEPPAACPAPWSLVVLAFSASCAGKQHDRVAAVWLEGVELLRTTTAEPTVSGVRWAVRKDVTRFSALLRSPTDGKFSVMLANTVNNNYTGVYHVNVSLEFYGAAAYLAEQRTPPPRQQQIVESYFQPADLVMPISEATSENGYWFRIQDASNGLSKAVTVPPRTYRAVLEVFVSCHADDEFWYSNPPNLYTRKNNKLTSRRSNAAYREVVVTVGRRFAGSFVPFPVIYTGGINPLFWQPVVALGTFNLPSYDVELTPFLGRLLDGKAHNIGITVVDAVSEWLVDANLHLWLDQSSTYVSAELGPYKTPHLSISRQYSSQLLDGTFEIRGRRKSSFTGWVNSSFGNFTTEVESELKLHSLLEFTDGGTNKTIRMTAEQTTELFVRSDSRTVIARQNVRVKYPLWFETLTEEGEQGTSTVRANLTHALNHETETASGNKESSGQVANEQRAVGWVSVRDDDVLNGSASTYQVYRYSKDGASYERKIGVRDGRIFSENITERSCFHRRSLSLSIIFSQLLVFFF